MQDSIDNARERKWLRKQWSAVLFSALGALVLAGLAVAANSASFTDAAGDVTLAPDVTALDVTNDDAGTITIRVAVAGGWPNGYPGDGVGVALDLDQNPDTGTVYYGTEALAVFETGTLHFARAAGDDFSPAQPPPSLQGTVGNGFMTFSFNAADLGLTPSGGFNIVAVAVNTVVGELDTAPDIRTFNYQLVAGTPPPVLGPDTRAPLDRTYGSHAVHGKVARLWYGAADGRGLTADTLRVYRRARLLRTIRFSLGDTSPFLEYYARWRVPRKVRGRLRFCVQSVDAAGNKSNVSCGRLVIR
jgi:hypothetical protein